MVWRRVAPSSVGASGAADVVVEADASVAVVVLLPPPFFFFFSSSFHRLYFYVLIVFGWLLGGRLGDVDDLHFSTRPTRDPTPRAQVCNGDGRRGSLSSFCDATIMQPITRSLSRAPTTCRISRYGKPRSPTAGTLPVDAPTRGVELFYVFTSKLSGATSQTPIILWLQGGGGASPPWGNQTGPFALDGYAGGGPSTFGMLCEKMGPFSNPDNSTGKWVLKDNPNTWNNFAHMIFIDQPAGVGLSSFSASNNGYASNGTVLGHDVATALVGFFARHPELSSNPFYVFGESYAGHYVPHVSTYILEHGHEPFYASLRKQFVGVGLATSPGRGAYPLCRL